MKKGLFLIFYLAYCSISYGQYSVSGVVLDQQSNPLPGATVLVDSSLLGTFSNQSGEFRLSNLSEGPLNFTVKYIGYEDKHISIRLSSDVQDQQIQLSRATILANEFVVASTRASAQDPMTNSDIEKEEIEEINLGRDIPYLLNFSPSVVSTSDAGADIGYTGMRIRGVDQSNINSTINGVALNDAESHGVFWVNMPDFATSLNSVQIQRGVGTSTNGSGAFGATVNMLTDHAAKDSASAQINNSFGSFNTIRNSVLFNSGLIDDHWNFSARLSSIKSDGYIDRASSDLKSYFVSGGYHSGKTSITALVFGGKEVTYQSWNGIDSATLETERTFNSAGAIYDENWNVTSYYDNEVDNYQQDHSQLIINQQLSDAWLLSFTGHYTYGRGYFETYKQGADMSEYNIAPVQIGDSTIAFTDLIRRKWLDNHFYGGVASLQYRKAKTQLTIGTAINQYVGDHFGRVIWARYAGNTNIRHEYYENQGVKDDFSAYVKMSYFLSKNLIAYGDLQFRSIKYTIEGTSEEGNLDLQDNFEFVNPKAGLRYSLNDRNSFYASYAIANREPKRSDYVDNLGELPKHERLDDIEIGHEFYSGLIAMNTNFYYMNYTNQLVLTGELNDVGTPIRENVGSSYRMGIEWSAQIKYGKHIEVQPNVTYSVNQNVDYKTEQDNEVIQHGSTNIVFSPDWISGIRFHYFPIENVRLSLYNKFVGEQYMNNENSKSSVLDAYNVTDFQFNYEFGIGPFKKIRLTAMVNNILDTEYVSNGYMWGTTPYYYPQATRNYMMALGLTF